MDVPLVCYRSNGDNVEAEEQFWNFLEVPEEQL